MIRFLGLDDQIYCDKKSKSFAFYDTVIDEILSFDGSQVFDSVKEFVEDYKEYRKKYKDSARPLNRFLDLIEDDYFGPYDGRGYYIEF